LRIAIVVDTFPSVSETFISNKVKQLSAKGNHLIVFCVKKNDQLFQELFEGDSNVQVVVLSKQKLVRYFIMHPFKLLKSKIKAVNFRQNLLREFRLNTIKQYVPDIIHFEFSGMGVDYLYEIRRLKGKKVVSCRGSAEKVKLLIYEERKEKFKELLNVVDAVHCVSKDMVNTIMPYCTQPEKIFINFPSIDPLFFQREKEKTASAFKLILSVGRMTFQKGYTTALLAIKLLKETGIPFRWVIVGNGNKYEEIIFKIHQLGLQNEVMLVGSKSREEVQCLMEEADIFFLPSLYEGIANVVLEAMSMQLPVVVTKSGGMNEVIDHEENGLLTELYDYKSMANNLARLCTNKFFCNYLGTNARRKVIQHFNIETQVTRFEKVYHQLKYDQYLPCEMIPACKEIV
jgi:colanic acid/amylovoran biosynthesis glycosyltransferase